MARLSRSVRACHRLSKYKRVIFPGIDQPLPPPGAKDAEGWRVQALWEKHETRRQPIDKTSLSMCSVRRSTRTRATDFGGRRIDGPRESVPWPRCCFCPSRKVNSSRPSPGEAENGSAIASCMNSSGSNTALSESSPWILHDWKPAERLQRTGLTVRESSKHDSFCSMKLHIRYPQLRMRDVHRKSIVDSCRHSR
jgi:hypothetical protein